MLEPNILLYIHHHGKGHLARCKKLINVIQKYAKIEIVAADKDFSHTLESVFTHIPIHLLPSKWEGINGVQNRTFDRAFEGVPFSQSAAKRARAFHRIVVERNITGFISDVSAELTIYARGAGLKVLMQRHSGDTSVDPTQVFAYQCSEALYAPYPELCESPGFAFRQKTHFLGMLNNDTTPLSKHEAGVTLVHNDIRVIDSVCKQLSYYDLPVKVISSCPTHWTPPSHITFIGRVDNLSEHVKTEVVICGGGNNTVCELLSRKKKLVIIPEEKPYQEQLTKARRLDNMNAAVLLSPAVLDEEKSVSRAIEKTRGLCDRTLDTMYQDSVNLDWSAEFEKIVKDHLLCPSQ